MKLSAFSKMIVIDWNIATILQYDENYVTTKQNILKSFKTKLWKLWGIIECLTCNYSSKRQ